MILKSDFIFLRTFLITLIFISTSCSNKQKFDKKKWTSNYTDDIITYENRNEMLDDLLKNYTLKGKKINEIENILGKINDMNGAFNDSTNNVITFSVLVEWSGIEPYNYKHLHLHYNEQTIIDSIYITEYSNN
ncbi:MAG: hypothetical protein H6604_00540 [Flavobacteriales bacterium]|nr:hypothetical protein [Flavobacteriales bacterium]